MGPLSERAAGGIAAFSRAISPRAARLVLAAALAAWAPAAAGQACNRLTATDLVFSGYTPFGGGVVATTQITYHCPRPVSEAWLTISAPRVITAGGASLVFELYADAGLADPWPAEGERAVTPTSDGVVTVYAFLPPQDAAAGLYAGTLTVGIRAAQQRNDTALLAVSSVVADACVIDPGALAFGAYDALAAAPLDAAGSLSVACTRGTAFTVGLGAGANAAGATRQMARGAARLRYEIYTDPGRTTVWSTTVTAGGTAPSTARQSIPVYGRIPAGQPVPAGGYGDTVQSTINF